MTVNAARRVRRRAPEPPSATIAPSATMAIGEINQTVFDCPACSRPLALGARRCPGCGVHLVLGVPLAKASVMAGIGLAIGIAIGVGAGVVAGFGHTSSAAPAVAARASASPIASPIASPGAAAPPTSPARPSETPGGGTSAGSGGSRDGGSGVPDIPSISRSELAQAIVVDGRLATAGLTLRSLLEARTFDASAVAQTLRAMSADSVFAQQLAARIAVWPGSARLGGDLAALYGVVHATAAEGLVASVRNARA